MVVVNTRFIGYITGSEWVRRRTQSELNFKTPMASCITAAAATTISVRSNPKAGLNISPKYKQTLAATATPFFNSAALRKSFPSLSVSSRSPRSLIVKAVSFLY